MIAGRARARLASVSGHDDLDVVRLRIERLEEAVAEQLDFEATTAADLDELTDQLVELAGRGGRGAAGG